MVRLVRLVTTAFAVALAACGPPSDGYDVVILNGRVMDPETGFDAIQNDPIRDHESFDLRLIYEPIKEHRIEVKLGSVACPETTLNGCQVPSGGLAGQSGPYLSLNIVLFPSGD